MISKFWGVCTSKKECIRIGKRVCRVRKRGYGLNLTVLINRKPSKANVNPKSQMSGFKLDLHIREIPDFIALTTQ